MRKKILMAALLLATALYATACGKETETPADVPEGSPSVEAPSSEPGTQDPTEEASGAASEAAALEAAAKAAEEEADTCYEVGRVYLYGLDGHKIDLEAACASFEKALELGKTEANFYLGVLYDWYGYPEKNFEMARVYYEAAGDDPYAWLSLGFLYYNGQGVEEDTAKAQELFEAVIAKGCKEGYLGRGAIAVTDEDCETALEYYKKALEGEEQIYIAAAMYDIAYIYFSGQGVEQDYAKALEWFEKSADLGYSAAMNGIGYMYHYGEGVEQDFTKALEWLEKSADLGDSTAMINIASMYENGEGVEQDFTKAIEWYEKSADLDNTDAMGSLGIYYLATQKYAKALGWFEKAADLGNADAMDVIAYMYENGIGVARNSEKAQEWHDKAEDARK